MSAVLWLLVAVPAVVGSLLCLAGPRAERVAPAAAVLTGTGVLLLAIVAAVGRPRTAAPFLSVSPAGLAVDGLSAVVVVTVAAVALAVLVFATRDVTQDRARFHGLVLLFIAAVLVTVSATTLPALLAAWEVMGATSYALIGFVWSDDEKVGAGATAFLTTRAADLGLYLAAGAAVAGGAGLSLVDLPRTAGPWRDVVAAGLVVAALGKSAQLPFSFWLSRAMQGPSPVSALLHSAAMVAMGGYLLLREVPLWHSTSWAGPAVAWVGAATALALGAVAVAQHDLKQLLAASTSAQLGFVVLAAGVGAVGGGTAQLVAHAATKALLFLTAGAWLTALGTKQLRALRGAARRWPVVGVVASVGLASLAGVAPLPLWAAKDDVLARAREASLPLYLVGLAAAALSAAYSGKALWVLWASPQTEPDALYDTEERETRRVGRAPRAALLALASVTVLLGALALTPLAGRFAQLVGTGGVPRPGPWELLLSTALAVAVVLAVRPLRDRPDSGPHWAVGWLGLEDAAGRLVVRPVRGLSAALARFDDDVLDRGVEASAAGVLRLARGAARADQGGVDAVVERVATLTRRGAQLARRSQSGLLHQYYVQAVAVLGIATLLLLVAR